MINGSHLVLFSHDPEADRSFFEDVLGQPHVDAGGGWLIFKLPPAELAIHPTHAVSGHELFFLCDDIDQTVRELQAKGVDFTEEISDQRWGRVTRFRLPGGSDVGLYEAHHPRATRPVTTPGVGSPRARSSYQ